MSYKYILLALISVLTIGCTDAQIASSNLSKAAEQFQIERRIVFFNGITDKYLLSIQGLCSLDYQGDQQQLEVTCKVGGEKYKKHHLGLSDNVSYFSEQIGYADIDVFHYKIIFKPKAIMPDVDFVN